VGRLIVGGYDGYAMKHEECEDPGARAAPEVSSGAVPRMITWPVRYLHYLHMTKEQAKPVTLVGRENALA